MKKIYSLLLSAVALFGTTSCNGWLDINTDPNKAVAVESDVLYNFGMMSWVGNRCGGDYYYPLAFGGQTIATGGSNGWGNVNVYNISVFALGNTWKAMYASAAANFKQAAVIAETSVPARPNIAAQCKIAFAEVVYSATVLYGDIPYKEAWDIKNTIYPKFDSQKDILEDLLVVLDQAIKQVDVNSNFRMTAYDLAYKGDMDKWIRYANSLKFRIAMLMVDKDPSKATLVAQLLQENKMINSAAGSFQIPFEDIADKENPKFRMLKRYMNGVNTEFYANKYVLDPLKADNDPRLPRYFDKGKNATEFVGSGTNEEAIKDVSAVISAYVYRAEAPEVLFSYQEQLFLESEAYARGIGVAKDMAKANELYKNALIAAMNFYEVPQGAIDVYVANDLKDLTKIADPVKEIHLQQWIDLMDRPLEAFTQWRRSGKGDQKVPQLTVPRNANPNILMRRYKYSPEEATANPNTPSNDEITEKVWFDE